MSPHAPGRSSRSPTPALPLVVSALLLLGCDDDPAGPEPDAPVAVAAQVLVSDLSSPTFLTAPEGDDRIFVVERGGLVKIVSGGATLPTPFLDLSGEISAGGERGLLGMAFHPDYASNGYFYVNYTDAGDGSTEVVRYSVSADRDVADDGSAFPIISIAQPYENHNGGMLAFGPDGKLYVGMGDGGAGHDPHGNGQNPETLLGSMLRLDIDAGSPYAIPTSNPFVGHASYREETWAYGLRNPWRFTFDRQTGDLYIADVGQDEREEVNFQPASSGGGENYGWAIMEGSICHEPSSGCSTAGLTLPVLDYGRDDECAVTGGYVYRGSEVPDLVGRYLYADYCGTWVRSFVIANGAVSDPRDLEDELGPIAGISSFGEDGHGELYLVSLGGTIYKLVAPST